MATKVLVPRLGEGVDELTIVKWLKNEGDPVQELESLLEVETDKVVTEIPSPATGVILKIAMPENTPAKVGEVMAWIGEAGESVPVSGAPVSSEPASKAESRTSVEKPEVHGLSSMVGSSSGFLSPVVRKIAAEHNMDLSQIRGTGLNGRITKQDVLAYLEHPAELPAAVTHTAATRDTLIPVSTIRKQIAERMQQSKQISPHVLTVMEADMSRVVAHRLANKAAFSADGVHLTYTAYFIAAIAAALKAHSLVNSSWTEQGILVHAKVNVGMATSLGEEGLIVPVLRRADELSLLEIARAVNDLSARARSHKLRPEEVRDGTFTLTNHGIGGSLFAMPIINQPQCGILGVGVMQKRAVVVSDTDDNDAIAIRPMIYLSFVFDHRILDGASADAFLVKVKEALETWS
ncbi:MAG: 2-oxo acid dehydrogenase subunit E2 [Chloroflexi bacterium]|nr:2-oxo acid dehydrogenase subunit E2 [Chloroflexota bacterium]